METSIKHMKLMLVAYSLLDLEMDPWLLGVQRHIMIHPMELLYLKVENMLLPSQTNIMHQMWHVLLRTSLM